MKKTIIIIFMVLALLMTSTIPAYALGNDYTFSSEWYSAVLRQTSSNLTKRQNTSSGVVTEYQSFLGGDISFTYAYHRSSGIVGGLDYTSIPHYVYFSARNNYSNNAGGTNEGWEWLAFTSPVNITVEPNQTVRFESMLFIPREGYYDSYDNQWNLSTTSRLTLSDGTLISLGSENVTKLYSPNSSLGQLELGSSGVVTGFDSDIDGESVTLMIEWTNTTSDTVVISSINNNFSARYLERYQWVPNYYYGFFTDNSDVVTLPSYVEDNLINIRNELISQSEQLDDVLKELDLLNMQIEKLLDSQSSSSNITNNYYETVTVPSVSDEERQAEIEQKIEEAEAELDRLTVELGKAQQYDDFSSTIDDSSVAVKDQLDGWDYVAEYENHTESISNLMNVLFNNGFMFSLLTIAFALATFSYILFGKRG